MRTITAVSATAVLLLLFGSVLFLPAGTEGSPQAASDAPGLTLIADTPEEGFQIAIELARRGVTETQPDREVLQSLRPTYSRDAEGLIDASHVIAVHFQTVAAANDYWR